MPSGHPPAPAESPSRPLRYSEGYRYSRNALPASPGQSATASGARHSANRHVAHHPPQRQADPPGRQSLKYMALPDADAEISSPLTAVLAGPTTSAARHPSGFAADGVHDCWALLVYSMKVAFAHLNKGSNHTGDPPLPLGEGRGEGIISAGQCAAPSPGAYGSCLSRRERSRRRPIRQQLSHQGKRGFHRRSLLCTN